MKFQKLLFTEGADSGEKRKESSVMVPNMNCFPSIFCTVAAIMMNLLNKWKGGGKEGVQQNVGG